METRRWVNPALPQTMQIAVFLCYFEAVSILLFGLSFEYVVAPFSRWAPPTFSNPLLRLGLPVAFAAAGWLIANERKTGWKLGVAAAALPLACRLLLAFGVSFGADVNGHASPLDYDVIGLIFEIALFMLLVHRQSRDYQRIWFK